MRARFGWPSVVLPLLAAACGSLAGTPAAPIEPALSMPQALLLPTGAWLTPTAAPGAQWLTLNPDLPSRPDFVAGQAVATAVSPDGNTLLILTSGYNRNLAADGSLIAAESNEYVFVYDIAQRQPIKRQVLQLPNSFAGICWSRRGDAFYVTGGVDDNLHLFERGVDGRFAERAPPIALGHRAGLGLMVAPAAAGVAVDKSGRRALIANFENDSVSLVDLARGLVIAELDLRPGKTGEGTGRAGGEYPFGVAIVGDDKAYVSSQRDRQLVVLDLASAQPRVIGRIAVGGQPNQLLLDRAEHRLFVANGNSDSVSVIDTASDRVIETIDTLAPRELFANRGALRGANPNSLQLSPDERTLYATNGGTNSLAIIRLATDDDEDEHERRPSRVVGLVPTGWYPNAVAVSRDGQQLYVVNGKSPAGPNPGACRDRPTAQKTSCAGANGYIWQLTKAGFLTLPVPTPSSLVRLSWQVAENNHFPAVEQHPFDELMMAFLRSRIHHVIYVIKENRTYDQILGDLPVGDGDPELAIFPQATTPNHHALAQAFVTLDHFYDSGEVSGDGWNWSVSARTSDQTEKTVPLNYAGRGFNYDWEGANRNINVGYADIRQRIWANPLTPSDPDLLPEAIDTATVERGDDSATAYLWDAALRAGLSVRNYGVFADLVRYSSRSARIPLERNPAALQLPVYYPTKPSLQAISDPYYRGYDNQFPDYWRFREWEREFDQFAVTGELPALSFVRYMHDHFGDFAAAIDGVNTPELQMADNDYALGLLVDKISHSRFADDTLIFVLEDDAQNGADHVDAHRSVAYVLGPYVREHALVSTPYTTVSLVRTIEEVLGLAPLGLTDGLARPMSDLFEVRANPNEWRYTAHPSPLLRATRLPLRPEREPESEPAAHAGRTLRPTHNAAWWEEAMAGQDFSREDALDDARFNRALWRGLAGAQAPYPLARHGRDLSQHRETLLQKSQLPGSDTNRYRFK